MSLTPATEPHPHPPQARLSLSGAPGTRALLAPHSSSDPARGVVYRPWRGPAGSLQSLALCPHLCQAQPPAPGTPSQPRPWVSRPQASLRVTSTQLFSGVPRLRPHREGQVPGLVLHQGSPLLCPGHPGHALGLWPEVKLSLRPGHATHLWGGCPKDPRGPQSSQNEWEAPKKPTTATHSAGGWAGRPPALTHARGTREPLRGVCVWGGDQVLGGWRGVVLPLVPSRPGPCSSF